MQLSLGRKISIAIVGVLAISFFSGLVAIRSALHFQALQHTVVANNLASVQAAEELEIALLMQRGQVASYMLDDGNVDWLQRLSEEESQFDLWIQRASETARSADERRVLSELRIVHENYTSTRQRAIELFQEGKKDEAKRTLLNDVASYYAEAFDLCEEFIALNQALVTDATADVRRQVKNTAWTASISLAVTLAMGSALLWLFFGGVIVPLRRLAAEARLLTGDGTNVEGDSNDELRKVQQYVKLLLANVAETQSSLRDNQARLAHSERLNTVGKLAASVAHEIRNPLTAIKMWIFSLKRSFGYDESLQQKLTMISDEVTRLESIVRNFLEFSRPQSLDVRLHAPGELITKTAELVKYRLVDQQIEFSSEIDDDLPQVAVDAEQIRQVLLNLIINAIEAMPNGGQLKIQCRLAPYGETRMVRIRIIDSGTGISAIAQTRLFEPFFTTKDEGTGLGLCIAASIMARHEGRFELESSDSNGTRWLVWIPTADAT